MYDKLIDHIRKNAPNTRLEGHLIAKFFKPLQIQKKEHFLKQGYICKLAGFMIQGCYRNYMISSDGKEVNTLFGFENWWLGDVSSFVNQTPSQINCQLLEDTTMLTITATDFKSLLDQSSSFREYTQKLRSNAHLASVVKLAGLSESAKTRYQVMLDKFPTIEERISQKHIASFLQITPEAFCRLKKTANK